MFFFSFHTVFLGFCLKRSRNRVNQRSIKMYESHTSTMALSNRMKNRGEFERDMNKQTNIEQ